MKISHCNPPSLTAARRGRAAFTMVEIAICLGIIAFAMVAIIGVLPMGLNVQRENREDTIVNRDASFFLEAIRSGAQGIDELTNYVDEIMISSVAYPFRPRDNSKLELYSVAVDKKEKINGVSYLTIFSPFDIVGLLSRPKFEMRGNTLWSNSITAVVRGLNGRALDASRNVAEMAFRYNMLCEVVPFTNVPPLFYKEAVVNQQQTTNLSLNLYDLRLTMRWPLFIRGGTNAWGRRRATFRTLAAGEMTLTNHTEKFQNTLYFLKPSTFTSKF